MATIIWCARVRHDVQESRTEVERVISAVLNYRPAFSSIDATGQRIEVPATGPEINPVGFAYFTPVPSKSQRALQVALNVAMISSFEAMPGDPL